MFTFIRIPKSGSTSIMGSIAQIYPDFDKRHLTVQEILQDGQEHEFYTVIRNPIKQYVSMYYYVKGLLEQNWDSVDTPLVMLDPFRDHMDVAKQTDSLEDYLLNAPTNAFLGKYLSGLDPKDLACIGHLDFMDDTRVLFNKVIGLPIVPLWLKRNPNTPPIINADIGLKFEKRNQLEYELYTKGFEKFDQMRKTYLDM